MNAKFGVASYPSIHIETLRGSTSVYGPDSYEWLDEYLDPIERELYVITKEKVDEVLVFPNGKRTMSYVRKRGWLGFEYFIADPELNYLWGIWHEEAVYSCGTASAWLVERQHKLFDLLRIDPAKGTWLTDLLVTNWGKDITFVIEGQDLNGTIGQHRVQFLNCWDIQWDPPQKDNDEKREIQQVYLGLRHWPSRGVPFFDLRAHMSIQFMYDLIKTDQSPTR